MPIEPVTEESPKAPPAPLKLERQTPTANAKSKPVYSDEEALEPQGDDEGESDEYEKAVHEPAGPTARVAPSALEPLTRVDKFRLLAQRGLP